MGQTISSYFTAEKSLSVLMFGLDGSGKTTILYWLKEGEFVQTQPTIGKNFPLALAHVIPCSGFNREEIEMKNIKFTLWDIHMPAPEIGFCENEHGERRIRPMWMPYFEATEALIFVVDNSDVDTIQRAKKELHDVLSDPLVAGRKLLVIANEKDTENAQSNLKISEHLELKSLKGRKWYIHRCNAKSG
ncbi:hypothetical protein PMAYCL1PPCAC_17261, partial [Pristionchus mayeri]